LVILCDTGSHLKEKINKRGGWVGGEIVVPRPSASASLTGRRQKVLLFYFRNQRLKNCRFEELYDYFKRVDSSVKDSIPLALPKNLPKESIQESRIPRLVPPLVVMPSQNNNLRGRERQVQRNQYIDTRKTAPTL
jgi:hypothetical protein